MQLFLRIIKVPPAIILETTKCSSLFFAWNPLLLYLFYICKKNMNVRVCVYYMLWQERPKTFVWEQLDILV